MFGGKRQNRPVSYLVGRHQKIGLYTYTWGSFVVVFFFFCLSSCFILSPYTHRHLAPPPRFNHRPCLLHPSLHRATHDSACHAPPRHSRLHRPGVLPRPCVLVWQPGRLPRTPPRRRGCLPEAPLRCRGHLPEAPPCPTRDSHHLALAAARPKWVVLVRSFFLRAT